MPVTGRSFLNAYFNPLYQDTGDHFNFTMTNIMDNFYKSAMDTSTDGKFKAIVLSGLISGENTGAGDPDLDLRIVQADDGEKYYEVRVRPLDVVRGLAIPDPCNPSLSTERKIELIEMHEWARSEFSVTKGPGFPLVAAQEITCYYEQGKLSNSNYSRLRFENPRTSVVRMDCLLAFNVSTTDATDLFTGQPASLGAYSSVGTLNTSDQATDNSSIGRGDQIPNTILPYDPTPLGSGKPWITSIRGKRTHPTTGEVGKMHAGVDIGQPINRPLYAIADGKVTHVNKNSEGCGYWLAIKHVMPDNDGNSKIFYAAYCHCQDILVAKDQTVTQGQVVATVGGLNFTRGNSKHPHLHFNCHMDAIRGTTVDPIAIFGWYGKVEWKPNGSKERWEDENPDLIAIERGGEDEIFSIPASEEIPAPDTAAGTTGVATEISLTPSVTTAPAEQKCQTAEEKKTSQAAIDAEYTAGTISIFEKMSKETSLAEIPLCQGSSFSPPK